jgi:hypothetical protein
MNYYHQAMSELHDFFFGPETTNSTLADAKATEESLIPSGESSALTKTDTVAADTIKIISEMKFDGLPLDILASIVLQSGIRNLLNLSSVNVLLCGKMKEISINIHTFFEFTAIGKKFNFEVCKYIESSEYHPKALRSIEKAKYYENKSNFFFGQKEDDEKLTLSSYLAAAKSGCLEAKAWVKRNVEFGICIPSHLTLAEIENNSHYYDAAWNLLAGMLEFYPNEIISKYYDISFGNRSSETVNIFINERLNFHIKCSKDIKSQNWLLNLFGGSSTQRKLSPYAPNIAIGPSILPRCCEDLRDKAMLNLIKNIKFGPLEGDVTLLSPISALELGRDEYYRLGHADYKRSDPLRKMIEKILVSMLKTNRKVAIEFYSPIKNPIEFIIYFTDFRGKVPNKLSPFFQDEWVDEDVDDFQNCLVITENNWEQFKKLLLQQKPLQGITS